MRRAFAQCFVGVDDPVDPYVTERRNAAKHNKHKRLTRPEQNPVRVTRRGLIENSAGAPRCAAIVSGHTKPLSNERDRIVHMRIVITMEMIWKLM
ncbi:MAG TPA: hypothetical protein PKV15_09385 [Syntrophomonadaceae bacterium]|nr:hypothetical protein [Syntrophomonadaceae bacterium]HRX21789.1 hypothetical protein [Syntrophomonadaceae bacterium]